MAIQNEKDAALTLKNMKEGEKCTLHFDSTQRSKRLAVPHPKLLQQAAIFIETSPFCL